jgi:hypothetical protein
MRLRNIPGADEYISESEFVIKNPEDMKGRGNALASLFCFHS